MPHGLNAGHLETAATVARQLLLSTSAHSIRRRPLSKSIATVVVKFRDENTSESIDVALRIQCTVLKIGSLAELANNKITIRGRRHN